MNWLHTQMALLDAATAAVGFGVNWFVQSTLLITFGLVAGRLLRRRGAAVQSAVYRTTLAAVLICPIASWMLSLAGVSGWSLAMPKPWTYEQAETLVANAASPSPGFPAASLPPVVDTVVPARSPGESDAQEQLSVPGTPDVAASQGIGPLDADIRPPVATQPTIPEPEAAKADIWTFSIRTLGFVALGIGAAWLFISAVLLARLARAWWLLSGLRRRAVPADTTTVRICRELAARLRVAAPEVLCSPYLPSPCLVGLRRPAVLLPEVELSLSVRDVLIHELAHSLRRDCHWNLLRQLALSTFFFQPLLWKLSRRLETTAEEVCDDYVVEHGGDRQEYAHCLVDVAELSTAPMAAAGVGIVSLRSMLAQRVQRIMDTSRSLSTRVGSLLLTLVLAAGLVGTAIVGLVGIGPQRSVAEVATNTSESKTTQGDQGANDDAVTADTKGDANALVIRGTVLDPDGKQFSGADVQLYRTSRAAWAKDFPMPKARSDASGRFAFELPKSLYDGIGTIHPWPFAVMEAHAPGYAPAYVPYEADRAGTQPTIRLVSNTPIEGRIVDLEGRPVPQVQVRVMSIRTNVESDPTAWLEAIRKGTPHAAVSEASQLNMGLSSDVNQSGNKTQSDAEGRFRITAVGRGRWAMLRISGGGIVAADLEVVNWPMEPLTTDVASSGTAIMKTFFGARFQFAAEPSQPIEGVVRDAASGEPLAGVSVLNMKLAGWPARYYSGMDEAVSDQHGKYRLEGMPKGKGNEVFAMPADGQPYFMRNFEVPTAPAFEPVRLDLELHRGMLIHGVVRDKDSGEPISATVIYLPWPDNPHIAGLPEFNSRVLAGHDERYRTNAEGRFTLVGLPGRGLLSVIRVDDQPYPRGQGFDDIPDLAANAERFKSISQLYMPDRDFIIAVKHVQPAEDQAEFSTEIELEQGGSVKLTVVDETGAAVSGATMGGTWPSRLSHVELNSAPVIAALGLKPGEKRWVVGCHVQRNLGGVVQVGLDDDRAGPVPFVLRPNGRIQGRLLDAQGKPLHGVQLSFPIAGTDVWCAGPGPVRTDVDGRFVNNMVFPGGSYDVKFETDKGRTKSLAVGLAVEPGETIDLGTIDITSDERPAPVRTKAAANVNASASGAKSGERSTAAGDKAAQADVVQVFEGQVVDPTGKPVKQAELYFVYHIPPPRGLLVPIWKPVATTDAKGVFRFRASPTDFGIHSSAREFGYAALIAVKDGFGFAWSQAGKHETSGKWLGDARARVKDTPAQLVEQMKRMLSGVGEPIKLVVDDQPIRGRIVDIDGRPVSGARLTLLEVWTGTGGDLAGWRAAAKEPKADYYSARMKTDWAINGPQVRSLVKPAVTGDDGRFTLRGVGRGRIAELLVEGPGIESAKIFARTEAGEKIELMRERRSPELGSFIYYPAELVHVAGPSAAIAGVVRDAETKAPLSGVTVKSQSRHGEPINGWGQDFVRAVTDAEGRYRLEGMPIGSDNRIAAIAPPGDVPYLSMSKDAATSNQESTPEIDFDLRVGVWLEGRIVDQRTGKGLTGTLYYFVKKGSPNYEFARSLRVDERDRFLSDNEGRFRIAALPGPGFVTFSADDHENYPRAAAIVMHDGSRKKMDATLLATEPFQLATSNYHVVAEVDPATDAQRVTLNLELDGGNNVIGRVVDQDGKPVTGFYYSGQMALFDDWRQSAGDKFELKDYHPESPRRAFFSHSERNLAASAIVQGELPESLVVKLQAAGRVKGRLVDQDGSPLANCELESWSPPLGSPADYDSVHRAPPLPHNLSQWRNGRYETDEKGRFEISCLVPGLEYRLRAFDRASMTPAAGRTPKTSGPLDVIVRVEPGESKDLGDVRLADEATFAAAAKQVKTERPALPTQPHAVLTGQITLAGGNPVAEAHVAVIAMRIQHPRGGDLSPDGQVLAEGITDSSGKYRLNFAGASSKTHRYANVIARKDGYAVAWHPLNIDAQAAEVALTLAPEEPIRGRLVDIEGQPASGVRLLMRSVMKKSAGDLPSDQGAGYHGGDDVPLAWLQPVTSDVEGRFTLSGVPAGHGVFLDVAGSERFAPQEIALNTGMPKQRGERDGTYRPLVEDAAPGDEATLPLAPAQLFEGLVTYEDTGKPAGHARLTIWASQQQLGSMTSLAGNADEQGRYRISPHPGIRFGINAYPADGTAYLARQTALSPGIEWQTGDRVKHVDIQLPRGVLVRGSVLESGTNVPVAGASIQYIPEEANNPLAADHILTGWQGIKLSDEQGKFEIAVLPGPGRLLLHGPNEKYVLQEVSQSELNRGKPGGRRNYAHAVERIEPAPGADPIDVTVQIKAGATVAGRLVDELGHPIDEALVISRLFVLPHSPWWRGYGDVPPPTLGGKFELSGLGQDQEYAVYFLDAKRRLGATQMLRADSKDLTVVLQPCGLASARFVDAQGQPHVGFNPGLHIVITPGEHEHDYAAAKLGKLAADADFVANVDRTNYWPGPMTDEQGRVTFPALIPGATYRLETYKDGKPQVLTQFSVNSGESKDLGDVQLELEAKFTATAMQVKAKKAAAAMQPAAKDGPQPKEAAKREPASSHAGEAVPAADDPVASARIQLFGKVVRPDGNPAAGANVYLLQESPMGTDAVAVVATDADGGFAFDVGKDAFNVDETSEPWLIAKVLAKADGLGPAWALAASFEPSGKMAKNLPLYPSLTNRRGELVADQTLRLVTDDVPIEGRIVSIEGHPIAGARVRVMDIDRTGQPTLDSWLTAVENPLTAFEKAWQHLPVRTGFNFRRGIERLFPDITSDNDGRFRIVGVGRESIVGLQIEGPGIETRQVSARTRKGETLRIADRRFRTEQAKMIHGSNFDHVAGPSRPVKGVVRDKDTHQPLAGVKVQAHRLAGIGLQPYPNVMFYTLTDTEGRYQLDGLPVGDNKLLAIGPASEPYIVSALPAEVNPDQTETTVDFALKRGVWIRGRVSDASDGRPLRANVEYAVFVDNARRREAPGYSDAFSLWYPTDADGRFQMPGFVGRGIVGVRAANYSDYPRGVGADRIDGRETNHGYTDFRTEPSFGWAENYHAVAAVTPDENGANNECNFALVPGSKISGNLFDSAGDPLRGAMILGAVEASVWQPLEDASFAVHNVDPLKPRRVQFLHSERKLAGSVIVKGDEAGPINVKLEPWATITGRILDDTGNPLPNASLTSDEGDKGQLGAMPGQYDFAADADGRFKIEGLAPHLPYDLGVMVPGRWLGTVVKDLQLSPGETKDLGELSVKRPSN